MRNPQGNQNEPVPVNPYHYIRHCIGGKWKMTILHEIHTFGSIRFNQTLKVLPISEKSLAQLLRELQEDGLIRRVFYDTMPPKTEYILSVAGEELIPALDALYIWSIRQMTKNGVPIDTDNFTVHRAEKYSVALESVLERNGYTPDTFPEKRLTAQHGATPPQEKYRMIKLLYSNATSS